MGSHKIDYFMISRRWHSSVIDVQSSLGADCDTDHCPVAANVRERLSVSEGAAQKFVLERYSFKKLNEVEVKELSQFGMSTDLQVWRTLIIVGPGKLCRK